MRMIERHLRRAAEIATLAVLFALPLKNYESTARVLQALSGQKVDCSHGEAADKTHPFDLIAVFGAGSYTDQFGRLQPNKFQLNRMKAAAAAFAKGYASKILLIDGGEKSVLESSIALMQYAVSFFSKGTVELPRDAVSISTNSINTATNAQDLKKYMNAQGMEKVVSITDAFHTQRVEIFNCNYGINSRVASVEDMLSERQNRPVKMRVLVIKENLEIALLAFDPKGDIPTALKSAKNLISGPVTKFPKSFFQLSPN
jgi:vancomycin permeability regulator SanA